MDFDKQLAELQVHVAEAQAAVRAAATETHDQIKERLDQAQGDVDKAVTAAKAEAAQTATMPRPVGAR